MMIKLVLLRHGESTWNKLNKFTGWTDVPLSSRGRREAMRAGRELKKRCYAFDIAFTSVMRRAKQTLSLAEKTLGHKAPARYAWELNERHYGALQGLNKSEMAEKFGEKQVHVWRRSYDVRPPALKKTDARFKAQLRHYPFVPRSKQPLTECLKDTVTRVISYWNKEIVPQIKAGKRIIISGHGNSLRALVKHLDSVPSCEIVGLNIPTGIPLVYELDSKTLKPIRHYYLADKKALAFALGRVAAQGKAKR